VLDIIEISHANLSNALALLPTNSIPESKHAISHGPAKAEGCFTTSLLTWASIAARLEIIVLGYARGEAVPYNSAPAARTILQGN